MLFSEGTFIELLDQACMNKPMIKVARFFMWITRKRAMGRRFREYRNAPPGYIDMCLEDTNPTLDGLRNYLRQARIPADVMKSRRKDIRGRQLKWTLCVPMDAQLPFFMSPYNISPRASAPEHPAGVHGVDKVVYACAPEMVTVLEKLADDPALTLVAETDPAKRGVRTVTIDGRDIKEILGDYMAE